jgi:hypothetical protein
VKDVRGAFAFRSVGLTSHFDVIASWRSNEGVLKANHRVVVSPAIAVTFCIRERLSRIACKYGGWGSKRNVPIPTRPVAADPKEAVERHRTRRQENTNQRIQAPQIVDPGTILRLLSGTSYTRKNIHTSSSVTSTGHRRRSDLKLSLNLGDYLILDEPSGLSEDVRQPPHC